MTDNQPEKSEQTDQTTAHLLSMRQFAIGLTIETERMLEALGHPVQSAIVTRRERRNGIRKNRNETTYD